MWTVAYIMLFAFYAFCALCVYAVLDCPFEARRWKRVILNILTAVFWPLVPVFFFLWCFIVAIKNAAIDIKNAWMNR